MSKQLLIQGAPCPTYLLEQIGEVCQAKEVRIEPPTLCRFDHIERSKQFSSLIPKLLQEKLNWGFIDSDLSFADFQLIAFDMDSTLITIECIDEIADLVGKKTQIALVTEAAMQGQLDYRQSLQQRLALLAGTDAKVLARVYAERVLLSPGVREILEVANAQQIRTAILSGGFTYFTERLRIELGFDFATSNELEIVKGKLSGNVIGEIIDAAAKARHLQKIISDCQLNRQKTIAIGDGGNDLQMLATAGVSVAFHAKPKVREAADIAINFAGLEQLLLFFK